MERSHEKHRGVTISRRDLIAIPTPTTNLLWRGTNVRKSQLVDGKQQPRNIRIDVTVEGITNARAWSCGLEFDYRDEESFVCRPLRLPGQEDVLVRKAQYSEIPSEAMALKIAYLPPMSGLADREFIKQQGEIGFLIGQGQTAQILRNLCYQLFQKDDTTAWKKVTAQIKSLFGAKLLDPEYIPERSEIVMRYEEHGARLDLSSAGRGLQQTLLLLAYLYANPNTVLLLDEPDAHLETLRQRETYRLLTLISDQQNSQIIAASHSEVVLNEAAGSGKVVVFVGKPHVLNDKGSQVLKSLNTIGWDQYYQAEATGWVLYLEASSDLAILQAFAETLEHPAAKYLQRPFVHYVSTNLPQRAREHFFGLQEAKSDLHGVAIFDRLDKKLHTDSELVELMWSRREIENYFCTEEVLLAWVRSHDQPDGLFGLAETDKHERAMSESIGEVTDALKTLRSLDPWSSDIKATDDFLEPLFQRFFKKLELPLTFRKSDYHVLAKLVPKDDIDPEITEKLDAIVEVADRVQAKPE